MKKNTKDLNDQIRFLPSRSSRQIRKNKVSQPLIEEPKSSKVVFTKEFVERPQWPEEIKEENQSLATEISLRCLLLLKHGIWCAENGGRDFSRGEKLIVLKIEHFELILGCLRGFPVLWNERFETLKKGVNRDLEKPRKRKDEVSSALYTMRREWGLCESWLADPKKTRETFEAGVHFLNEIEQVLDHHIQLMEDCKKNLRSPKQYRDLLISQMFAILREKEGVSGEEAKRRIFGLLTDLGLQGVTMDILENIVQAHRDDPIFRCPPLFLFFPV